MRFFMLFSIGFLALSTPAAAQWFHTAGEEDPFKKGRQHIAMASELGETTGFRCSSKDDLALLLIVSDKPKAEDLAVLRLAKANLLVIVDNSDKVALPARIEATPDGNHLRFVAEGDEVSAVAKAAAAAKRRFAVAVEFMGQMLSSRAFGVRGSGRAVGALVSGCKL